MHNIKILIAEELDNSQLKISEHLKKEGDFNVLGSYEEEAKLLNTLKIVQVDVLIVTLFKAKFDGVKIIGKTVYLGRCCVYTAHCINNTASVFYFAHFVLATSFFDI